MNAVETVQSVLSAIEANDWERARGYLADDFIFGGAMPEPIGPDAWLGVHRALGSAMPDFSFNVRGLHDENGQVAGHLQITGTQTRELALPMPGIPPIQPTGKRVSLPAEDITVATRSGKLVALMVGEVAGGGLPGILAQLGVALPAHA